MSQLHKGNPAEAANRPEDMECVQTFPSAGFTSFPCPVNIYAKIYFSASNLNPQNATRLVDSFTDNEQKKAGLGHK